MPKLVLTLMADDRPGLIQSVSNAVVSHGGNWLESRLARLGGKFAGIVSVEVPAARATGLRAALQSLEASGVRLMLDQGDEPSATTADVTLELDIAGADHPGIVHEIAELLAARRINVEEMSTTQHPASMSGAAVFEAWLRIRVPAGIAHEALRGELEKLAQDLMVDLTVGEAGAA